MTATDTAYRLLNLRKMALEDIKRYDMQIRQMEEEYNLVIDIVGNNVTKRKGV